MHLNDSSGERGPTDVSGSRARLATPIFEARHIAKVYGHVRALSNVTFSVAQGEVVALVGDNGAGKSTLVGCLSGSIQPTSGQLLLRGEPVSFASPRDAHAAGIETVYQDLALAPDLSAPQNLFLGREVVRRGILGHFGWLDRNAMRSEATGSLAEITSSIGASNASVGTFSGGQRQAVAIARARRWASTLIMLDEPTAALGVTQSRAVLEMIAGLRAEGLPVILISHNLSDVFAVATRIVVLRLGRVELDTAIDATSPNEVIAAMTGVYGGLAA